MRTKHVVSVLGVLLASVAVLPFPSWGETLVLPVVVQGVRGMYGSFWDSEVRIMGQYLVFPGQVRRVWVAMPGGGFLDDPATAPHWTFPPVATPDTPAFGAYVLTGAQLLQGTSATHAAIALEMDGTNNEVYLRNANIGGQARLPENGGAYTCCLSGNGQLIRALRTPLVSNGFIPWLTSGSVPFRVSVGVINASDQPRSVTVYLNALVPYDPLVSGGQSYWLLAAPTPAGLKVDLPPWGFRQIDDFISVMRQQCTSGCDLLDRVAPAAVFLQDLATQLPFYAYASVIYSPLNDPEFIAAVPPTH
jgi:hypothetical protein